MTRDELQVGLRVKYPETEFHEAGIGTIDGYPDGYRKSGVMFSVLSDSWVSVALESGAHSYILIRHLEKI